MKNSNWLTYLKYNDENWWKKMMAKKEINFATKMNLIPFWRNQRFDKDDIKKIYD